jgi:hypothetical protein
MQCIFLEDSKDCTANLPQYAPHGIEMDEETIKNYCKQSNFLTCPRYKAYMEYTEKSSK